MAISLLMGFALSAFAIPPEQVLFVPGPLRFSGQCCVSLNQTVALTEPAKPAPVVVTFEMSQVLDSGQGTVVFGLMLNGGACKFYGSAYMPFILAADLSAPRTFQWVVVPSDGLRAGRNTFTLCGGGLTSSGSTGV